MTDRPTPTAACSSAPDTVPSSPRGSSPAWATANAVALSALVAVLALAAWFRLSSLGAAPIPGADEAYYGLQASRLAGGEAPRMHTVTGNVIDPFLVLPQAPLYWFVEPAAWVPRLPVAVSGLLAAALLFLLLRRVLDGPTAITGAALHATLPATIVFARFGCEFGQTPLAGVVAAALALRGRVGWLAVSLGLAFLVHPTNVFLVPILGPVAVLRAVERARRDADPRRRRRAWRATAALAVAAAGASASLLSRREVRAIIADRFARVDAMDWGRFLDGYRTLLGQGALLPVEPAVEVRVLVALAAALLVVGTIVQARRRQWDRLALTAGLGLGMTALHLLGGPGVLHDASRYGAVLLTPTALVLASWIQAVFPRIAPGDARPGGPARLAVAASVGAVLLLATDRNLFRVVEQVTGESIWTFRAEARDPYLQVLDRIRADHARRAAAPDAPRGHSPRLVLAQDYFVAVPLQFLLGHDPDLEVVQLISIPQLGEYVQGGDPMAPRLPRIADRLAAGAYVVRGSSAVPAVSRFLEDLIAARFEPDRVQRWVVPDHPDLRIYRIEPSPPASLALGPESPGTVAR